MADTDYKIVGTKMYIYPNTETEQQLMSGLIAPVEGYTTYITVQNYYKTVEAQTGYENRLGQYDYYLQCVRVPEWAPDAPTPPQPTTYKSITVNDSYSLDYVLVYENQSVELDPSAVEVGKNVVFSTNDPSYTQTFPAGLEVEEYGTLPSGAVGYKFTMPDYDVEITIIEAQPQPTYYDITLVNEDSITVELWDENWNPSPLTEITPGTNLRLLVKDNGYEAVSSDVDLGTPVWESSYNQWQYQFTMPSSDITITIQERQTVTVTLTVVNQDSRHISWYDGVNWYRDTHTAHVGDNIDFICWETSDKITFGSPIDYTEELDSHGRYLYHFVLNGDLTVTTAARTEAGIYYDETLIEIILGETPTYPTLENPNSVTPITYTSSNTDLATVDSSGNVTLISNVAGEAYITATFEGDSTYDFTGTHFKLKVKEGYDVRFIPDGDDPNIRFYNITKQEYIVNFGNAVRPGDEIFVTDASYNQKVMYLYRDGSWAWNKIQFDGFDPITVGWEELSGGTFTMPSYGLADGNYILIMDNSSNLYDISKNFSSKLYNESVAWWYDEEDPNNPGTYITKYPEGFNLGIESRNGETYTINPAQTQEQGGSVGMYIVMPGEDIEITKTN